jgi:quercetin dioxygenase-like cupin family protein
MKKDNLNDFTKGWVIGNFEPNVHQTNNFEVAVKNYKAGDYEEKHYHKIATEWTIISKGKVEMNGIEYSEGDVITIEPGEATDFKVLEDTTTTVIKIPCVTGDKYLV